MCTRWAFLKIRFVSSRRKVNRSMRKAIVTWTTLFVSPIRKTQDVLNIIREHIILRLFASFLFLCIAHFRSVTWPQYKNRHNRTYYSAWWRAASNSRVNHYQLFQIPCKNSFSVSIHATFSAFVRKKFKVKDYIIYLTRESCRRCNLQQMAAKEEKNGRFVCKTL